MRRLGIRLIIMGILLGGGWISYQVSDYTSCSGPRVEAWMVGTTNRFDLSISDLNVIQTSTRSTDFSPACQRAKQRYLEQQSQDTPSCLSTVQEKTVQAFYYEWKTFDALDKKNYDVVNTYFDKAAQAREDMELEIDRMAIEYDWGLDN